MPIVDPEVQHCLNQNPNLVCSSSSFFIHYLTIASENLNRNVETNSQHAKFTKYLNLGIDSINDAFFSDINLEEAEESFVKNYYQYLMDNIFVNDDYHQYMKENYFTFANKPYLHYYRQPSLFPENYFWYFRNDKISILCIKANEEFDEQLINFINIEINLIAASGFIPVIIISSLSKNSLPILEKILFCHSFAEIHFTLENIEESTQIFLTQLRDNFQKFRCYIYFYSRFMTKYPECKLALKELDQEPLFKSICFSAEPGKIFANNLTPGEAFPFQMTGFEQDKILVSLFDIPLFESDNEHEFTTCHFSGMTYGYVSSQQFMEWSEKRIPIILPNSSIKYVVFEDLHLVRPDLFIDPFYLFDIDQVTLDAVTTIMSKSTQSQIINTHNFLEIKMTDLILFAVYMIQETYKVKLRQNQILAIYEACKSCFSNDSNGFVYQIQTGEGKSFIIQAIAIVLALSNKQVHIATSNIILANRDYNDSYDLFRNLGLTSNVLLQFGEMPNFNNNTETSYKKERYPKSSYDDSLFDNPSNMNISIFDEIKNKKKDKQSKTSKYGHIIFSTPVNFEIFYLHKLEQNPNLINDYFKQCYLLVDEADSILIDELANGTILSKPMNTNAKELLFYVYQSWIDCKSPSDVLKDIIKIWPNCTDLDENDIKIMFEEIALVNQEDYIDGRKYSIRTLKNHKKKGKNIIKILFEKANEIQGKIGDVKEKIIDTIKTKLFSKKKKEEEFDEEEEEEEEANDLLSNSDETQELNEKKVIIPFDYDHKGILEPNKEFSGFIQQFIAIKEIINDNQNNQNLIIKNISMLYMHISHPMYIKLYHHVCGFTGTIGDIHDKELLNMHYKLDTIEIPRHNPQLLIELPIHLCGSIKERNKRIIEEVIIYHKNLNPVLIVIQDLNEIAELYQDLQNNGIGKINIFDGNQKIKPDYITGKPGAVSIGTNCCGRGTNIITKEMPLHVIISYYTSNTRVMRQLIGRTARFGNKGSVHIICLENQFLAPAKIYNQQSLQIVLDEFSLQNKYQIEFLDKFRTTRKWIFEHETKKQSFDTDSIKKMRKAQINVNRIVAYRYKFPICMSPYTFVSIQMQRIFSIFNCPNCKHTWILFQRYVRETVLESWSLLINKYHKECVSKSISEKNDYLKRESQKLYEEICKYMPVNNQNDYNIVNTFLSIFDQIVKDYQNDILRLCNNKSICKMKTKSSSKFISFNFGFRPYSLRGKSGARINRLSNPDEERNFIVDPELRYIQNKSGRLSITQAIDSIFDSICRKINDAIGGFIGLKFFLRRTLGGCEFGLCFDFCIKTNRKWKKKNCLIDQDPLFVFTIYVRSLAPILAGILIFGLVYIASISKTIGEYVANFSVAVTKKVVKEVIKSLAKTPAKAFCNAIISFLDKNLEKQLKNMIPNRRKEPMAELSEEEKFVNYMKIIKEIILPKDFSQACDNIKSFFEDHVKIHTNSKFASLISDVELPMGEFFKIGLLLLMCISTFLMGFNLHKRALVNKVASESKEFEKTNNPEQSLQRNQKIYNGKDKIK